MEEKTVKTLAIVLVSAIALYAVYKIFEGSPIFSSLGTPGATTPNLTSIPGVPAYSATGYAVAAPQQLASAASGVLADYSPAFGSSANPTSSSETDYSDIDFSDDESD
jgi:hypothetical protein